MGFQEFEETYGHLLPWKEAELICGRNLDWNNNMDCCVYHGLLERRLYEFQQTQTAKEG